MTKAKEPTTQAEREAVENCIRRMMDELETDQIEVSVSLGKPLVWLDLVFAVYQGKTLDEAYIKAAHDRAGTEPPPF